jgi:ribosomal protein S16
MIPFIGAKPKNSPPKRKAEVQQEKARQWFEKGAEVDSQLALTEFD